MSNDDSKYDKYVLTNHDIEEVVRAIPGDTLIHKVWGSITVVVYVARRCGLRKANLIAMIDKLYSISEDLLTQPDLTKTEVEELNESMQKDLVIRTGLTPDNPRNEVRTDRQGRDHFTFTPTEDDFL